MSFPEDDVLDSITDETFYLFLVFSAYWPCNASVHCPSAGICCSAICAYAT